MYIRSKCKHGGPQQATTMMQSCQNPSIKKIEIAEWDTY
jgi:hypothetical protein